MTLLAVDGDILAYRIAAVCEEDFAGACDTLLDGKIKEIAHDTGIFDMRIYLTGENNFRYDVAVTQPYKGNREGKAKPYFLKHCEQYLTDNYKAITVNGFEADDAIASDMVQTGAVHCGIDKDIYQVEGRHYNFVTKEWLTVDSDEATLRLYRQILTGDKTDNIPGLHRVGEKTAEKIINDPYTAVSDAKGFYRAKCPEDVDVKDYWKEQVQLIEMKTNLEVPNIVMTIERKVLDI